MRNPILIIIILILFASKTTGQNFDLALTHTLQQKLDSIRTADNIQGISAAIYHPEQGLWEGVSGESHPGVPISPDMRFHIASNTKTFTAVMMLKLVENHLVELDDSIHNWLPDYNPNINPDITIRQLLNHTSGIANTFDVPGFMDSLRADWNRVFTPSEILSWLPEPKFLSGKGQYYSNPNYHLAGLIIENASGQNMEQLIRDSILTPLEMTETFFPIYDTVYGTIAHPWQSGIDWNDTSRTSLLTSQWAAGAMYSTAGDMAQLYNKLFNYEFLGLLEFGEMSQFAGPQKRGLGIQEIEIAGQTVWGHGGNTIGYSSTVLYDTTSKAVVAVLMNDAPAIPLQVADLLLSTIVDYPISRIEYDRETEPVIVYPNPSNRIFTIQSDNYIKAVVYNMNGKMIYETKRNEINMEQYPSGSYLLKITSGDNEFEKKIIIVK